MLKLVGDNPFHGVSHLSQQSAVNRSSDITNPRFAAKIVKSSIDNGADGFMFSISDTTLAILKELKAQNAIKDTHLYGITPAAGQSARSMSTSGGVDGLIQQTIKQMVKTRSVSTVFEGLKGMVTMNPENLLRSFINLEDSKIRNAAGKNADLDSIMLHEIVTDLALALDLDWFITSFVDYLSSSGIVPGFQTRNFCYLVKKLHEWHVNLSKVSIAAPFNKVGFLMLPTQGDCERCLDSIGNSEVIAISVLAAGYLRPAEAIEYIRSHQKLRGLAIGVSTEKQALETFKILSTLP